MNCARKHTLVTGCSSGIGRATALRRIEQDDDLTAASQDLAARARARPR